MPAAQMTGDPRRIMAQLLIARNTRPCAQMPEVPLEYTAARLAAIDANYAVTALRDAVAAGMTEKEASQLAVASGITI